MADKAIKLFYGHSTGRAELSRLILAASGVEWEDIRFTSEEWLKYKPDSPFGQAPYLIYHGTKAGQSVAIASFLAREFGFAGKTNLESLRIDEVEQLVQDLVVCGSKVFFEKDETKKAEYLEKLKAEDIPKFYGFFERLLKESGTGYFVGNQLTMADFAVYDVVVNAMGGMVGVRLPDLEQRYPLVHALCAKVETHPNIQKYLQAQKAKKPA
nr:hypothetical protein BaRGS_000893 [Batillaria attramentaria]